MEMDTIGIDLEKAVFHLVGLSQRGEIVVRKKLSRTQLLHFTANLRVRLIGMESCGGAHFLGRALREQGHDVRLIPAQYVKAYVKTDKNDYIDAEAIAEAAGRPKMRFVPIKSDDQLDMQSLHRVRDRWVGRRTSLINQIRGLLLERGITVRQGRRWLEAVLPGILEDPDTRLSGPMRMLLAQLQRELKQLQIQIEEVDEVIVKNAGEHSTCRRLMAIPGIGPLTATAVVAAIGNGAEFSKGRNFATWLGLVPGQYSTGGKQKLLGISKRGNRGRLVQAGGARPLRRRSACETSRRFPGSEQSGARLGLFFGLVRIGENLLADYAFGGLAQILIERARDLQVLRPERLIDERPGRANQYGRVALTRIPIGAQTVAAAERQKRPALPWIGQAEAHLDALLGLLRRRQRGANPVERGLGGLALPSAGGALEQRRNLPQLLAKLLFCAHWLNLSALLLPARPVQHQSIVRFARCAAS